MLCAMCYYVLFVPERYMTHLPAFLVLLANDSRLLLRYFGFDSNLTQISDFLKATAKTSDSDLVSCSPAAAILILNFSTCSATESRALVTLESKVKQILESILFVIQDLPPGLLKNLNFPCM